MARRKYNSLQSFLYIFIVTFALVPTLIKTDLTSLAKNDVFPVFTTLNIDDAFLLTKIQLEYKDEEWAKKKKSCVSLSISPFGQDADRGKTIKCEDTFVAGSPTGTVTIIELGDLTGFLGGDRTGEGCSGHTD